MTKVVEETKQIHNLNWAKLSMQGDPVVDSFVFSYLSGTQPADRYLIFKSFSERSNDSKNLLDQIIASCGLEFYSLPKEYAKASHFFRTNRTDVFRVLGTYSLPYCFAAANGAKVLYLSDKFRTQGKSRLQDTASFVENLLGNKETNTSEIIEELLRVRVIHAMARYFTVSKDPEFPAKYNYPINQIDLAGTNLAFGLLVLKGLRKKGKIVSKQDEEVWLKSWAYFGQVLGIEPELGFSTWMTCSSLEVEIANREFRASEEGNQLTRGLISSLKELSKNYGIAFVDVEQEIRSMVGVKVSSIIGL